MNNEIVEKGRRGFGLQWHVTDRCDQRCKHCYIYRGNGKFSDDEPELALANAKKIIGNYLNFCKEMDCNPGISITGGDPLLYPHIWELLSYIREQGLRFSILGNPFHLTRDVCARLLDLRCFNYQMSLDGLEETHDYIRRKGSYQSTIKAIRMLKEAGLRVVIMTTVSSINYKEVAELVRVTAEEKVNTFSLARCAPSGKNGDNSIGISPNEYRMFFESLWPVFDELKHYGTKFSLKDHLWKLFLYEKGLLQIENTGTVEDGCNCAITHMTVLQNGAVYACRRFESPVGNALESSFVDIFLGSQMDYYRQIEKRDGCGTCELLNYCRGCPAVSHGTFGSFYAKDPQCWKSH